MARSPRTHVRNSPPPAGLVPTEGWRDLAACHNHPTLPASTWDDTIASDDDMPESSPQRKARVALAMAACRSDCPVQTACLRDVDLRYDEGVRGGIDLRELRKKASA